MANAQSDDLIAAAGRGDLPAVNAILKAGADVNDARNTAVAKYSVLAPTTALMEASSKGHLQVVQALLAANADVNATRGHNATEDTALALAVRNGHLNVVQALLAANADVNAGSIPALYVAAMVGNPDMVRVLLAAKPDLDWRDSLIGATALMQALAPFRINASNQARPSSGRWDVARLLVEAGANVNVMTKTGVTALMLAAQESSPNSLAMVQTLLAAHADVNGGGTAAARQGLITLTPIANGGNPQSYSRGGYTALGLAASAGSVEIVQALLDANAQRAANPSLAVNAKQPRGSTPLTIASAKGRSDVVRLLLAAKADVSAADGNGKTALMQALESDHPEVAELLRSAVN